VSHQTSEAPAYRPDIDGLRAIAVLSVAFYHARLPGFGGGFVGVDVFFVISGYLVTQILVKEIHRGSFSLLGFYERRVRRIFPALFVVLLAAVPFSVWILLPDDLIEMGKSLVATTLFSANFLYWTEAGYFDSPSWTKPLLHTWSLAVEEQFYIVFPALLLFARSKLSARYIAPTIVTGVLSFVVCVVGTNNFRDAAFFLAPARAWEFALGCLLALGAFPQVRGRWAREIAAALGLGLIAYAVARYSDRTKFPGVNTVPPVVGATLLIWAGSAGASAVSRLLSTGPAVGIGLISYSLYLWHWPMLVFFGYLATRPLAPLESSAVIAAATVCAWASWRWVERPFRGSASPVTRHSLVRTAVSVSVLTLAVGSALALGGRSLLPEDPIVARLVETRQERKSLGQWCNPKGHRREDEATWRRELGDPNSPKPSFVVWGDSHACMVSEMLDSLARNHGRRGYLAGGGGCPPLLMDPNEIEPNECGEANDRIIAAVTAEPSLVDIVLAGRWAMYFEGSAYRDERIVLPSYRLHGKRAAVIGRALERTVDSLERAGRRVWIVAPVPETNADVPAVLARARRVGRTVDIDPRLSDYLARQRNVFAELDRLRERPGVHVLLPHERLCEGERCRVVLNEGDALYFDTNHLSHAGVALVQPLFEAIFK
jgi:peptidoglycan/LPS O-acetylase OafA/YrhL